MLSIRTLSLSAIFLSGCFMQRITYEQYYDEAKKEIRQVWDLGYHDSLERNTPFASLDQSVVLTNNKFGNGMMIYETLNLGISSYDLSPEVYVMVDHATYRIPMLEVNERTRSRISEDKDRVATSDSTSVEVVTGYSYHQWKSWQYRYLVPEEVQERIKKAGVVKFRYYAGPEMMTVQLPHKVLWGLVESI